MWNEMNIDIVGTEYLPHFFTKTPYISQTPPPPHPFIHILPYLPLLPFFILFLWLIVAPPVF